MALVGLAGDGAVRGGVGRVEEREVLFVAVGAWLALRPRQIAAGVGDAQLLHRRSSDLDLHYVLAAGGTDRDVDVVVVLQGARDRRE